MTDFRDTEWARDHAFKHADEIERWPCILGVSLGDDESHFVHEIIFRVPFLACPPPNDKLKVGYCDVVGMTLHLIPGPCGHDGCVEVSSCQEPCDEREARDFSYGGICLAVGEKYEHM